MKSTIHPKGLLLLVLLLSGVLSPGLAATYVSELVSGTVYRIENSKKTLLSLKDGGTTLTTGTYSADAFDATLYWYFIKLTDGKWTVQNLGTGRYISGTINNNTDVSSTPTAMGVIVTQNDCTTDGNTHFNIMDGNGGKNGLNIHGGNEKRIVGWWPNDSQTESGTALSATEWNIAAVPDGDLANVQDAVLPFTAQYTLTETLATQHGLVRLTTDRPNAYVLADAGSANGNALTFSALDASSFSQLWQMKASSAGYTLQNMQTGRYVSVPSDKFEALTTSETATECHVAAAPTATVEKMLFNICSTDAPSVCLHYRTADGIAISNGTDINSGSAISVSAATDVNFEDVRTVLYEDMGWDIPKTGRYYRIYNGYWSSSQGRTDEIITEASGVLTTAAVSSTNKAQVWQLTSTDGVNFSFKNLETGKYIQHQTSNEAQYTTGTTATTFPVGISTNLPASSPDVWYNITDTDGDALKMERHQVVNNSLSSEIVQSYWRFKEASAKDEAFRHTTHYTIDQLITNHNGIVVFRNIKSDYAGKLMVPRGYDKKMKIADYPADLTAEENYEYVWLLERTNDAEPYTYSIRNLGTGEYIGDGPALGDNPLSHYIQNARSTQGAFNISKGTDFTSGCFNLHDGGTEEVAYYSAYYGEGEDTGSTWYIEPAAGVTQAMVDEHLGIPTYTAPANGKYYKIVSRAYGDVITVQNGSKTMKGEEDENLPSQWWKITTSGGKYAFQNVATNTYIQSDPGQSHVYELGENPVCFSLHKTEDHYGIYITQAGTSGALHQSASQSDQIVSWGYNADASRWYFEEITLTEDDFASAEKYHDFMQAESTTGALSSTFLSFFNDASASQLKINYLTMTDARLRQAMSTLPTLLQDEAVKVKNNTWEPWEREFRVADYSIFSDANDWKGYLQTKAWGVINNPTGVVAEQGDVIYVVVGSDIPKNATLTLEARKYYDIGNNATQTVTLQKGLNALPCANNGSHIYIRYESAYQTDIADYPALNIHVIGGRVHGYINTAKHTDADWVSMRENGLFWAEQTDLLGKCAQVRLQTDFATQNGESITPLIDIYDWYVSNELDLMGVTAVPEDLKHLPNANLAYEDLYPRQVNNRLLCISKKDEGGNPHGAEYEIYVPGSGNYLYDNLKNKDGGSVWVFGHEWGHVNQGAINIAASDEASNNLFSNALIHRGGTSTSRGWNVQELQRKMANERSVNASGLYEAQFGVNNDNYLEKCGEYSWPRTVMSWDGIGKHFTPAQMFYQLYLYYHAAGHNPLFYPRLFCELRKDPLNNPTGVELNKENGIVTSVKGNCTGEGDYLHFAKKACDAAGENLEDFFEAWGFFVPVKDYFMECYSQRGMTTTQDMIDDALDHMRQYPKANESIIFIDDRAVVSYQADGTTPKVATDGCTVKACTTDFAGAQYSTFNGQASHPSGLSYARSGNTLTLSVAAENIPNAAGVKFYDAAGKLVYFASQTTITIPNNLANTVDHSKTRIALSDGTTMPLYESSATGVYEQTIYHGNGKQTTRYTNGEDNAVLSAERDGANALAFVVSGASETLARTTNVVVGDNNKVAHNLVLTDKADFYTPHPFTAATLTYERTNTAGFNSFCVPFALSTAEMPEGCRIKQFCGVQEIDGEHIVTFTNVDEIAAGTACLVYCPEEVTTLTFTKENTAIASTPAETAVEGEAHFLGTFQKTGAIGGPDVYKLNSAGTAFGYTTEGATVTAFRTWLNFPASNEVRTFRVLSDFVPTGIDAPTLAAPAAHTRYYDLQGRPVRHPRKNQLYIHNGRLILNKESTNDMKTKKRTYLPPTLCCVELENESCLMNGSPGGNNVGTDGGDTSESDKVREERVWQSPGNYVNWDE